ncbi:RagB/SusD family nutrient uptake outer membrane protein [Dysgonomonas sp. 511]|uniref:RagB/SusD family nutrient uptake outer membrane protein n=1 Tax=Dysgonomonas sp. 511 TaxID=2302930 RepID=UPI0013D53C56|nr:RagB/SusD family nutrient uptake outer membrane protein [Dysgonomonas sp. 511]NDV77977.1 RagB/SusD family nutrient uptake outer membrane protein [Dysgonomonas sp. 511]
MKKFIYRSLLALSLVVIATSCDLEADPKSSAEEPEIFSTYGLAEKEIMSIYQSFAEEQSYRGRFLTYNGINSDIEWINNMDATKIVDDGKYELCTYAARPTNSQMNDKKNAYAKMYEGIERANLAIKGLLAHGRVDTDKDMAYLLGEALTLRAILYVDLIRGWGDVPARFEPVTNETIYTPRSDRDVIYKQILKDLKDAQEMVAWPNEATQTTTTERVNKALVKGLRARVALYAGGYSQRKDGIRLSTDPELERTKMYTIARDECVDILTKGSNNLGTFYDNFKALCEDKVTAGRESIFEIPFSDTRGRVLYTFGVKHQGTNQYTGQAQGGINGPLPYLFYDYDVEDVRRDITCVPYEWNAENPSKQQLRSLKSWCFGKLRYEWMTRRVTSSNDDGINWQYMRLADIYLMAAEAINELSSPADAKEYLKPILDRALPAAKVDAYMDKATASKSAFFDAIVEQRAFEFAGETLRKADLIRWNLLKVKLDEAKAKMLDLANRTGAYADLPAKLYFKTDETDNETLIIYGLNHGETDAIGETLTGYAKADWIKPDKLTEALINSLYQKDPDQNQVWPIWQTFIDYSNGALTND